MILSLDVGNSQIYGGLFDCDQLRLQFRRNSKSGASSDELGLFLRAVIRENDFNPKDVRQIAFCSVVPEVVHSLRNACKKYFDVDPFVLQAGVKTGLKIKYRNPLEVGADRIANAIAATHLFPQRDLIIVDFGTATTFCVVSASKEYLGGVILAGMRIAMEALEARTSKLPTVEILTPKDVIGRSTVESIQSGLFFSNVGAVRELVQRISIEAFQGNKPLVIGTGGFSNLFAPEKIFDQIVPELVLKGLYLATKLNSEESL